jgi:hypothetical protein
MPEPSGPPIADCPCPMWLVVAIVGAVAWAWAS